MSCFTNRSLAFHSAATMTARSIRRRRYAWRALLPCFPPVAACTRIDRRASRPIVDAPTEIAFEEDLDAGNRTEGVDSSSSRASALGSTGVSTTSPAAIDSNRHRWRIGPRHSPDHGCATDQQQVQDHHDIVPARERVRDRRNERRERQDQRRRYDHPAVAVSASGSGNAPPVARRPALLTRRMTPTTTRAHPAKRAMLPPSGRGHTARPMSRLNCVARPAAFANMKCANI